MAAGLVASENSALCNENHPPNRPGEENIKSRNTLCELTSRKMRARVALLAIVAWAITAGGTASALIINLTFDSDTVFLNAGLTATDIVNMKAACNYAALQFTSNYTDNITVNIRVTAVAGTGTLGQSSTTIVSVSDYTTLRNACVADATTTNDATTL